MEKEAYLLGNILFRDWEDNKKIKENKKMNTSRLKETVRTMVKEAIAKKMQQEEKKPDQDGDGVPDWADKKPGKDDREKSEGHCLGGNETEDKSLPETKYDGPRTDKSMTGQANLRKPFKKPEPKPTDVGGTMPSGKKGFSPVYSYDFDDDGNVSEQELDMKARASTTDFKKGGIEQAKTGAAGGVTAQERALVQQISQLLLQAAQQGNLAQGSVTRYINMAMEKVRGMLGDGGAEPEKELDEKFAGSKFETPAAKKKERDDKERRDRLSTGAPSIEDEYAMMSGENPVLGGPLEDEEVEEGGVKEEYENKFADIKATSKLYETKQTRLNKLLMEWCTK